MPIMLKVIMCKQQIYFFLCNSIYIEPFTLNIKDFKLNVGTHNFVILSYTFWLYSQKFREYICFYAILHIAIKFAHSTFSLVRSLDVVCKLLYACLQTGRIMVWWCLSGSPSDSPSVRPSGSPSTRFPHFSPTCFDIVSRNFTHNFVLMYYRSSFSVVTLRQFFKELCLFVN